MKICSDTKSGLIFAKKMREQKATSSVPVVLIWGHVKKLAQTLPQTSLWDIGEVCLSLKGAMVPYWSFQAV